MTLRALTLIQPMGSAIVSSDPRAKRIENRPRALPKAMIGRETVVAVHAGLKWSEDYARLAMRILGAAVDWDRAGNLGGNIIGLMRLTGRQFTESCLPMAKFVFMSAPMVDPWYAGPFGYEIAEAVALESPIPCRGMQGWWPVPDDVTTRIAEQLAAWLPAVAHPQPLPSLLPRTP